MYIFVFLEFILLFLVFNNVVIFCLLLFLIVFINILVCVLGELKFFSKKNNIIIKIKMKKLIV